MNSGLPEKMEIGFWLGCSQSQDLMTGEICSVTSPQWKILPSTSAQEELHKALESQDEGIGIPLEDQQHLFESFRWARNVGTISGAGLRLAVVKNYVTYTRGKLQWSC